MKNSMTTTTASTASATSVTSATSLTTVKITATDKYLTFRECGKVIGKIAKGEGYIREYDLPANVTKVYKSYYAINGEIKIDVSTPDFVIHGDLCDFVMDFCYENRNVKFVGCSCEQWSGEGYIGNDTCSVYCGK